MRWFKDLPAEGSELFLKPGNREGESHPLSLSGAGAKNVYDALGELRRYRRDAAVRAALEMRDALASLCAGTG